MRQIVNINAGWRFCKTETIPATLPEDWEELSLPHTWNAVDGQDGGGDYFRGHGVYAKILKKKDLPASDKYYLEKLINIEQLVVLYTLLLIKMIKVIL